MTTSGPMTMNDQPTLKLRLAKREANGLHYCKTSQDFNNFVPLSIQNMYRYSFRFVVMSITILTANLITTALGNYLVTYRNHVKPLTFTFLGMAVIVMIFYPLFARLEIWVKDLSTKIVRKGKSLAGKYLGLFLAFAAAMVVLAHFYAKMWYHINLWRVLVQGEIGKYL